MTADLPALYAEAWTEPRRSMRRVMSMGLSERDRIIMVAFSLVLFAIPLALMLRSVPLPPEVGEVSTTSILLTCSVFIAGGIAGYYFISWLVQTLGRRFGGTASREDCRNVSAWSQLVTGIANLLVLFLSFVLPEVVGMIVRYAASIAGLIVFSAYVAEAHGFQSVQKVAAVSFGIMACLLVLMSALGGAPS